MSGLLNSLSYTHSVLRLNHFVHYVSISCMFVRMSGICIHCAHNASYLLNPFMNYINLSVRLFISHISFFSFS